MGKKIYPELGVIFNPDKEKARKGMKRLLSFLRDKKIPFLMRREEAEKIGEKDRGVEDREFLESIDLLLTVGGDGTLLRGARLVWRRNIPLLGINLGGLGFLTSVGIEDMEEVIHALREKRYYVEERKGLETDIKGEVLFSLNDTVFFKKEPARMIRMETSLNERYLTTFDADGLIVSSPTGSTAHALSAGGPILHPDVEGFLIVPICSHTLSQRPLVIPAGYTLEVCINTPGGGVMVCDGQITRYIKEKERVQIKVTSHPIKLVRLSRIDFYSLLREKFQWKGYASEKK